MTDTPTYPPKISNALHEVMVACAYVQKKKTNKFHGYKYAGEGDLLEVLRPAMVDAGLMLIPSGSKRSEIDQHGITHVEVEYTLVHRDGDVWPEKIVAFGEGGDKNKNGVGDKGTYKALTGANKYLLFKLFQIETGDDPEQSTGHDEAVTNGQAEEPYRAAVKKIVRAVRAAETLEAVNAIVQAATDNKDLEVILAANKNTYTWLDNEIDRRRNDLVFDKVEGEGLPVDRTEQVDGQTKAAPHPRDDQPEPADQPNIIDDEIPY